MRRPSAFRPAVLLLLLILAAAALLRFTGISRRGPAFFDEGIYTLEGQWIGSFSRTLVQSLERKIEETRHGENLWTFEDEAERFRTSLEGQPPVWGRPGFSLLTALCLGLAGPRVNTANLVSAFFGTLAVLGIFLLGRALYGTKTGLLASLLLALSGYHLIYSVTGLADGSAMSISLFAVLCYHRARQGQTVAPGPGCLGTCGNRWLFLAGLFAGLAFTVHDRFLYVLLVILVSEGMDLVGRTDRAAPRRESGRQGYAPSPEGRPQPEADARPPAEFHAGSSLGLSAPGVRARAGSIGRRSGLLVLAFLLPLFLCEFPYYLGMVVLRHFETALPFRTYFEELFSHHLLNFLDAFAFSRLDPAAFPEIHEAGSRLLNLMTYPYLFYQFNGLAFCLLFLVGLAVTAAERQKEDRLLLVWLFLPFLLLSLGLSASVRYALVFLPAATLIAARSLRVLEGIAARVQSRVRPAPPSPPPLPCAPEAPRVSRGMSFSDSNQDGLFPDPGTRSVPAGALSRPARPPSLPDSQGPERREPMPLSQTQITVAGGLRGKRLSALFAVLLPIVLSSWHASREIRALRCSYEEPVGFLREKGPRHISLQYPVSRAWLGVENVREPPLTFQQLRQDYEQGFRYYLIDYRKFFLRPPFDRTERGRIIEDIEAAIEPAFCTIHPCYAEPCFLFEVNVFFGLTRKLVREARALGVDRICIYDLEDYFRSREPLETPP